MTTQTTINRTYTIMETARLSGLPESTLRYYESIGIIKPIHRDVSSKHRVYTEDDMNFIISLACLSATGMSIDDMRVYIGNRGQGARVAQEQIGLLSSQRHRLKQEAHFLELRQRYVDIKIAYWNAVGEGDIEKAEASKKKADVLAGQLRLPSEN
jgi:DNA-binding transcriptional MerR regulator